MITVKNVKTLDAQMTELRVTSSLDYSLDAEGQLLLLPALIDSHISLGVPSRTQWAFDVESVVRGGIATVLDMPSEESPNENKEELEQKRLVVGKQLADLKYPLRYFPYVKGNSTDVEELGAQKKMTKGSLLVFASDDQILGDDTWDRIFQIAAWEDLPVVINSLNENLWERPSFKASNETLLEKAIYYAERQNARLYVLNVATQDELNLIQEARSRSLLIYAETTPEHLFPLQSSQADFLWDALNSGIIETIGSGYRVERQTQEKMLWKGTNFDFLNPIFLLPLLFTAYHEGKISLENIVRITRVNLYDIFKLERKDEDFVLVDLEKEQVVERIGKTQSVKMNLKGWPEYILLKGHLFKSAADSHHLTRIE